MLLFSEKVVVFLGVVMGEPLQVQVFIQENISMLLLNAWLIVDIVGRHVRDFVRLAVTFGLERRYFRNTCNIISK